MLGEGLNPWGQSQTRAVKMAPLGWKWCSGCSDTKRLSEFPHVTKRIRGKFIKVPQSRCSACKANSEAARYHRKGKP